jgi:hypothetical protein
MALEEKCCPVCHRGFDTAAAFDAFLEQLQKEMDANPKALA